MKHVMHAEQTADNDIHLAKFVFTNKKPPPPRDAVCTQRTIN